MREVRNAALNFTTSGDFVGLYDEYQGNIERGELEAGTSIRMPKCDSLRLNHLLNPATDKHMNSCSIVSSFPEIKLIGGAHSETRKFGAMKPKQAM